MREEDEKKLRPGEEETAFAEAGISAPDGLTDAAPREEEQIGGDYFADGEKSGKKKRKRRRDMTPEEKKKRRKRDLIIAGSVLGLIAVFCSVCAIVSYVGYTGNFDYIATVEAVEYDSPFTFIEAEDSDTGYYEFVASSPDDEFRILHLTDIHLGAGPFSAQKDRWALDAVRTVVQRVKPDLVIVTGDLGFPVPYASGTLNNKREIDMFGTLMEELDVYWTVCFGNHDTEIYSLYNREEISDYFEEMDASDEWDKFLYREGPEDIAGYGNDIILVRHPDSEDVQIVDTESYAENVENTHLTQAMVMFDSHSYTDGDYFGIAWKYDNIHGDQIDWYAEEMDRLAEHNDGAVVKSLLFFHIPLREYGKYWEEYKNNGHQNTENVTYVFGKAGESGEKSFPGVDEDLVFETAAEKGGQGIFCGHDHYNTYAIDVKTRNSAGEDVVIRLEYGMSIDYIAYAGISKNIEQRGGTEIKISPDGSFQSRQRPYQGEDNAAFM